MLYYHDQVSLQATWNLKIMANLFIFLVISKVLRHMCPVTFNRQSKCCNFSKSNFVQFAGAFLHLRSAVLPPKHQIFCHEIW